MRLPFSLGVLIKILKQNQMELVVDKLIEFSGGKDEELRDISGLGTKSSKSCMITLTLNSALKTITAELPPDGKVAATACAKLTPKLLAQIQNVSKVIISWQYSFYAPLGEGGFVSWILGLIHHIHDNHH